MVVVDGVGVDGIVVGNGKGVGSNWDQIDYAVD